MKKSNYEWMRDKMEPEFLKYDQQKMIEKFSLEHDVGYLYINFVGRSYRIHRTTGKVQWSDDGFIHMEDADYNEAMSIFDVLCYAKEGCCLSGKFVQPQNLKGTVWGANPGGKMFSQTAEFFDHRIDALKQACEYLGGEKVKVGDAGYILRPFSFLPMMLQFWESDEEFPATLKIMWDENVLQYVHYETTYFIAGHVMKRLREF